MRAVLTISCLLQLVACSPKEKIVYKYITIVKDTATSEETTTSNNDVLMSGALVIGPGTTALSLDDTAYSLYCVTFEDKPIGFSIATTSDGTSYSFKETLKDLAGRPFGCFFRENNVTKSTIDFSGGSTMLTGGGQLVFDLKYDPDTKISTALVDMKKSTALYSESIAAAKSGREVVETSLGDLSGIYNVACEADTEKGLGCDQMGKMLPSSVYMAQFEALAGRKVALWESKAKHDQCVPAAATEQQPRFGFGLSSNADDFLSFDFRGDTELAASMSDVWAGLSSAPTGSVKSKLKKVIENRVRESESWRISQCSKVAEIFQDLNCRFVPTEYNSYTYLDPQKGVNVTNKSPMWFSKFCDAGETPEKNNCAPADYSGSVRSKSTVCTEYWTKDSMMCPAGTSVDEQGKGSFTGYFATIDGEDAPMRLVCKGSNDGWISYQDLALASNKSSAVSAAQQSLGCDVIPSGSFQGLRILEKQAVINSLVELSIFPVYNNASNVCRNRTLPAGFNFANCAANPDPFDWASIWDVNHPKYNVDQSADLFCQEMNWRYSALKLKIDRDVASSTYGKLIGDSSASGDVDQYQAREFCPNALAARNANTISGAMFNVQCVSEINSLALSEQLAAGMRANIGMWNIIPYLACGDVSGITRANMQDGMNLACLPQANMSMMCDQTKCVSKLRCDGTEKGKCFANSEFMGRIDGRLAVMDLKESVNKAFEASSTVIDQFPYWNPTGTPKDAAEGSKGTGAMELCTMVNSTNMSGRADSGSLDGFFKNRVKRKCESMPSDFIATGSRGAAAGGMNPGSSANQQNLPEIDIMMKVKFVKP